MSEAQKENPRIELIYIGCRESERGKPLHHLWYDLTGISNDGSPLKDDLERHQLYGSKKKGHTTKNIAFASPGAIYSFERSEGGVYGTTGRYLGRWANEEDVLKWTAEHNAIDSGGTGRTVEEGKQRTSRLGGAGAIQEGVPRQAQLQAAANADCAGFTLRHEVQRGR